MKRKDICEKHPDSPRLPRSDRPGRTRCSECSSQTSARYYHSRAKFSLRHKWVLAKIHAHLKKQLFILSFEEFQALISQPCVYRIEDSIASKIVGLDRKDNDFGYTRDNSLPCCQLHNSIKSNVFTYEQMLDLVQRYRISCGNRQAGRRRKRWAN
jgi:hypothetical protein